MKSASLSTMCFGWDRVSQSFSVPSSATEGTVHTGAEPPNKSDILQCTRSTARKSMEAVAEFAWLVCSCIKTRAQSFNVLLSCFNYCTLLILLAASFIFDVANFCVSMVPFYSIFNERIILNKAFLET
uniref:Uncharacterized protein n=1 Tax=Ixodes ricinus TaxID=34613 RepID=A0A0K8RI23_IXORI